MSDSKKPNGLDRLTPEEEQEIDRWPTVFELSQLAALLSSGVINLSQDASRLVVKSAYRIWDAAVQEVYFQRQFANVSDPDIRQAAEVSREELTQRLADLEALRSSPIHTFDPGLRSWETCSDSLPKFNPPGQDRLLVACIEDVVQESPSRWAGTDVKVLRENGLPPELFRECVNRVEVVAERLRKQIARDNGKQSAKKRKAATEQGGGVNAVL